MQYCSLQQSEFASTTSHIHNWVLLFLWLCLFIVSGVISPLISSSILGTHWLIFLIFLCPFFLLFSYCSWGSQHISTEVVCHSLLQWDHILSELSIIIHPSWVALYGMAHSCIELDKAVIHGSVWLVFCDCAFHSVCPLTNKDKRLLWEKKRLLEASWWEGLTVGESGSCSGGWGHIQ